MPYGAALSTTINKQTNKQIRFGSYLTDLLHLFSSGPETFFLAWGALYFKKCFIQFPKYCLFISTIFLAWETISFIKCPLHFLRYCHSTDIVFLMCEAPSFIKCLLKPLEYCLFTEVFLLKWETFSFKTAS